MISTPMTLDDFERRKSPYFFADFGFFAGQLRHSG